VFREIKRTAKSSALPGFMVMKTPKAVLRGMIPNVSQSAIQSEER
jgi:hypothetical protein